MANPQPDKFTRISNELFEAIMQTNFSKRQRSILDLVIRTSYGCGKKFALLKPSDFEVVGVYKSHIKKELDYLVRAKVIFRDGERISLNKDYEQWRVSLTKISNQEKLSEILRKNLTSEVTKTVTDTTEEVTEIVTEVTEIVINNDPEEGEQVTKTVTGGYQNSNPEVTKTVTDTHPSPPINTSTEGSLKKLKDILKITTTSTPSTYLCTGGQEQDGCCSSSRLINFYEQNIGLLSPLIFDKLVAWEEETEEELVLLALEKAVLAGKRNFSYIEGILKNWRNEGIKTRKAAEIAEQEFQQQRRASGQARTPPGAKKHPDDRPFTPEEKKRLEELNIELAKIAKEIPP